MQSALHALGVGGPCCSRPICPLPSVPSSLVLPLRDVRVYGRNDGYSKSSKKQRRKRAQRTRDDSGTSGGQGQGSLGGLGPWWEDDSDAPSSSGRGQSQSYERQYDDRRSRGGGVRLRDALVEEEEAVGWWQKPEERSLQAYAPRQLNDRQIRRLEELYAVNGRKMKIQEVAAELDLDRVEVLQWVKEFRLRPDSERQAIISQRREEVRVAEERAKNEPRGQGSVSGMDVWEGRELLQRQQGQTPTGFIPFYTRKENGMAEAAKRRLSADAVRTLESIYNRNPFPPDDVIKGMWDLHRVNRDTVLQWLSVRRAQDGIVSRSQQRTQDRVSAMSTGALRQAMGPIGYDSNNLLVQLAPGANGASANDPSQAPTEPPAPKVVRVSERQLALFKSSLPSPHKRKGKKRADEQIIESDETSLLVGSVRYVKEEKSPLQVSRWAGSWRYRRARQPTRVLPLLVNSGAEESSS